MNRTKYDEIILQILFFIAGIYILIRIFIPLLNRASAAVNLNYSGDNFYEQILNKSNSAIDIAASQDDEDTKDIGSILFTYLTGIDLSNPKTYIASQIPLLQFIDITSIVSKESGPVVITPRNTADTPNAGDNPIVKNNPPVANKNPNGNQNQTPTQSTGGQAVKPNDIKPPKKKLNPSKPMVLIYHTHTTEAYNPSNLPNKNFSTDLNTTVAKIGETLEYELENTYGISTLHDSTIHDLPKRLGAYNKSRPTLQRYLKKYSSFKLIIDLHRDGEVKRSIETAIIGNEKYARVMLVAGTKFKNHDKYNKTAQKLYSTFESLYPGFCRGIDYKNGTYNQDLSPNTVLLEVGSNENSIDEVLRTTKIIAKVVAQYLK